MDYQSVAVFFETLKQYFTDKEMQALTEIEEIFNSMWKVSEKHTNIIGKELVDTLNK
jgi:hypothetical protein